MTIMIIVTMMMMTIVTITSKIGNMQSVNHVACWLSQVDTFLPMLPHCIHCDIITTITSLSSDSHVGFRFRFGL